MANPLTAQNQRERILLEGYNAIRAKMEQMVAGIEKETELMALRLHQLAVEEERAADKPVTNGSAEPPEPTPVEASS